MIHLHHIDNEIAQCAIERHNRNVEIRATIGNMCYDYVKDELCILVNGNNIMITNLKRYQIRKIEVLFLEAATSNSKGKPSVNTKGFTIPLTRVWVFRRVQNPYLDPDPINPYP